MCVFPISAAIADSELEIIIQELIGTYKECI